MKNWMLCTIALIVNLFQVNACGPFYPYGEDIRFSLLKPQYLNIKGFDAFHYSAYYFANYNENKPVEVLAEENENVDLWYDYFNGKVDKKSIYEAIYLLNPKSLKSGKNDNSLVKILNTSEYAEALNYIIFAKKCSPLNTFYNDPWERDEMEETPLRKKFIASALKYANKSTDETIKKRYAYLAIRMAFYSWNGAKVNNIYDHYFAKEERKTALDYWARHFTNFFKEKNAKRNVSVAIVFAHSMEKRFASQFLYDYDLSLEEVLSVCQNDQEKSDVYMMHITRQTNQSLNNLKEYTKLDPTKDGLEFLVVREVNKMEDWILTPYYTLFTPSITSSYEDYQDFEHLSARLQYDKTYAKEFADWMKTVDPSQINDQDWWNTMQEYVSFLSSDIDQTSLTKTSKWITSSDKKSLIRFRNMVYALESIYLKRQEALTDPVFQNILLDESKAENNKLIFAVARELEYTGFTTDAASLLSTLYSKQNWLEGTQFWRTPKGHTTLYSDFYDDYFFYLDAYYETSQVEELISAAGKKYTTSFDLWRYMQVKQDMPRLNDLIGTKYMRENKLDLALTSYEKVPDSLWRSEHYAYKDYLDANPFYADFYSEHRPTAGDTLVYTKPQVVKKLIYYLNRAEKLNGDQQAWCYFQAANCYFNMTQYGNSWMMKRYFWTANANYTGLVDDDDYFKCKRAQEYYRKAKNASKSEAFAALSLRMLGRCKSYEMYDESRDYYYDYDRDLRSEIFEANPFYRELKNDYPDHYFPLINNCESFVSYYGAVRI